MSLDVYLTKNVSRLRIAGDFLEEHGFAEAAAYLHGLEPERVYDANITHNLNRMAEAAGIYKELWRPEEVGITKAGQLVEPLRDGLLRLKADPHKYQAFNASNGWGLYEHFVPWVEKYIQACEEHPEADVRVSR
jgi:hypothetical protein